MGQSRVILLDTHVLLWLASDPAKLSGKAKAAIQDARRTGQGIAICDITLLELATMANKGRLQLNMTLESLMQEVEARFTVLPITGRACLRTVSLPGIYPKDPADRIIGATALVEGLALLTADSEIRRSKIVDTIW
jgi:PIN domain nuclease of toxin-antitoxin system